MQKWDKLLEGEPGLILAHHLRDEGDLEMAEITVYQQTGKNGCIKTYCEACKPQGRSERGTLIVSGYDNFCAGCGKDFKDSAEGTMTQQAVAMILEDNGIFAYVRILDADANEPHDGCIGGNVEDYLKRFHQAMLVDSHTFMQAWDQRRLQRAWQALNSVPSYVERYRKQG